MDVVGHKKPFLKTRRRGMLLGVAVVLQVAMLLYCYRLALRRNARRLQLWMCAHVSQGKQGLHVRHQQHVHGWHVCAGCHQRLLEGYE